MRILVHYDEDTQQWTKVVPVLTNGRDRKPEGGTTKEKNVLNALESRHSYFDHAIIPTWNDRCQVNGVVVACFMGKREATLFFQSDSGILEGRILIDNWYSQHRCAACFVNVGG